jgi:Leucine-rich repeat (LRR) protein
MKQKNYVALILGCAGLLWADTLAFSRTFDDWNQAIADPPAVTLLELGKGASAEWKQVPPTIANFTQLKSLSLLCMEKLEGLPAEIAQLKNLEKIEVDNGNGCASNLTIPENLGKLKQLKSLILYGALDAEEIPPHTIKKMPKSLAELQNLEELNLGRNGLTQLPKGLSGLIKLRILNLEFNQLRGLPPFLGNLKNLQEINLRANRIHRLPAALAEIPNLKILMGNNSLTLREQDDLKSRFPKIVFSFDDLYDDMSANQHEKSGR